jgi:O-succinylbenzoate synthase
MTAADCAALEARVTALEHEVRNVLPQKIDAVAFGVSVMHGEMTETLGEHGEQLAAIRLEQEHQGETLAEILRRLPGGPSNGPAGSGNDH